MNSTEKKNSKTYKPDISMTRKERVPSKRSIKTKKRFSKSIRREQKTTTSIWTLPTSVTKRKRRGIVRMKKRKPTS